MDGLLGGLDRLIAKKRDLKQAAMQQLLTGQTRLPGFHGEWEVKTLGDVADIKTGSRNSEDDSRRTVSIRSSSRSETGRTRINGSATRTNSPKSSSQFSKATVRVGSIVPLHSSGRLDVHRRVYASPQLQVLDR